MSSTPSDNTSIGDDLQRRIDETKISKADLNFVIMDYLINEGYPIAAERFAAEANIRAWPGDSENLQTRVEIRNHILSGNIQHATDLIKRSFPRVLDIDGSLHFSLLRLQLVELIRQHSSGQNVEIGPAVNFAKTHLAPIAPSNESFISDLERTMALLIYPPEKRTPALKQLLDPKLRQEVASRVNQALLKYNAYDPQPRLNSLVHIRQWAEKRAAEARNRSDDTKFKYLDTLSVWDNGRGGGATDGAEGEDSIMGGDGDLQGGDEGGTEPMAT